MRSQYPANVGLSQRMQHHGMAPGPHMPHEHIPQMHAGQYLRPAAPLRQCMDPPQPRFNASSSLDETIQNGYQWESLNMRISGFDASMHPSNLVYIQRSGMPNCDMVVDPNNFPSDAHAIPPGFESQQRFDSGKAVSDCLHPIYQKLSEHQMTVSAGSNPALIRQNFDQSLVDPASCHLAQMQTLQKGPPDPRMLGQLNSQPVEICQNLSGSPLTSQFQGMSLSGQPEPHLMGQTSVDYTNTVCPTFPQNVTRPVQFIGMVTHSADINQQYPNASNMTPHPASLPQPSRFVPTCMPGLPAAPGQQFPQQSMGPFSQMSAPPSSFAVPKIDSSHSPLPPRLPQVPGQLEPALGSPALQGYRHPNLQPQSISGHHIPGGQYSQQPQCIQQPGIWQQPSAGVPSSCPTSPPTIGHFGSTSPKDGSHSAMPPPQPLPPPPGSGFHGEGGRQGGFSLQQPTSPEPAGQPQHSQRLDPDLMPSPIQMIEEDRQNRSGTFCANQKGLLPPFVSTPFITEDRGYCNPRLLRSTMYNVPCTGDLLKASHVPFVLCISPFARLDPLEVSPPLVDFGDLGPVRCKRCKAYMNPYMQFTNGGRHFQCVFCNASTEVPDEYFAHLDHTGKRTDCFSRAELCLGAYEIVATKDYCKNNELPKEPAFIFMIDVSYNSVKSGLVELICKHLKEDILVNLPREAGMEESEIRVGFVTYHNEIHFYNSKSSLTQTQMMVVSDIDDMFVPLVDGFLVKLSESEAVIESLLAQIPQLFADSNQTEIILGPVIQAGLDALVASSRCGQLLIFHSSLPNADAPGKLKNRDDRKLLGTEKEKTILSPQTSFYKNFGQDCVSAGCSVTMFLFPNSYCDLATISDVVRLTGGSLYKYSYFQAALDGERFIEDLQRCVLRTVAFDAVMRVRASTGIRAVDFYGNLFMSNTTDVELASIDTEKSFCVEIKHDDKLSEADGAFVQIAVLYTSVSGKRRLRIINQGFTCCNKIADMFRSCELDALINFLSKQAVRDTLNHNPKYVREFIMSRVSQILACYRKQCASSSSDGQLILPESMKLLPLYTNCIMKNDGIAGASEISTDDRSYLMHLINCMNVEMSNVFFYPSILPFHSVDFESGTFPTAVRCSVERLQDDGVYLLENGLSMFLWISHNMDPGLIQKLFGVASIGQVDIDQVHLLDFDNAASRCLRHMVDVIRNKRARSMKLTVIRQRDKLEPWFKHFLVEDKTSSGSSSYVDFLCHIHKEIRIILN